MFRTYPSNIALGTASNHILCFDENRRFTARSYFRVESDQGNRWRFWFSNQVDSTFADGNQAYRNRPGGAYTILSARIGDGGVYTAASMPEPAAVTNWVTVTFDGNISRAVSPSETFWSDEIGFSLPKDHCIVWEWELEGDNIPCTPDSQAPTFLDYGNGLTADSYCPLPALFGCKRDVKKRIAFMGDSITQGCGTRNNLYEMWVGRIADGLCPDYSVWNLGLGWGRGSDAATDASWLYKGKQADIVCLAYGVNDILSGAYKRGRGDTAEEILASVEKLIRCLLDAGKEVILFTVPPFSYPPERYAVWKAVNTAYPELAEKYGIRLFDFSASLDGEPPFGDKCIYGSHPDGEGGRAAAEAFLAAKLLS